MQRKVISVEADMSVRDAAKLFLEKKISGAPVLDHGELVGMVSQTDLVRRNSRAPETSSQQQQQQTDDDKSSRPAFYSHDLPDFHHVIDVMTPSVIASEETTPVRDLARLMLKKNIHRIIITRAGKLAGIVTTTDFMKIIAQARPPKKPASRRAHRTPSRP
ncbi:MAG: CBS domain-containing protein [Elusimicrobiota bacterium]